MDYRSYDRDYVISVKGKADIAGSSDSVFLGDKSKYNPEDLLLASISSCHITCSGIYTYAPKME